MDLSQCAASVRILSSLILYKNKALAAICVKRCLENVRLANLEDAIEYKMENGCERILMIEYCDPLRSTVITDTQDHLTSSASVHALAYVCIHNQ